MNRVLPDGLAMRKAFASLVVATFLGWVLVGAVGTRLPILIHHEGLKQFFPLIDGFVALVCGGWLLLTQPKQLLLWASVFAAILLHSFCHIYWPSLRLGVPIQDYLLADQVSANYSFDGAKLYLRHMGLAVLAGWAAGSAFQTVGRLGLRLTAVGFGLVSIGTVTALAGQSFVDLSWLSQGSGSALGVGRAPGLLEDSGASTVYGGALVAAILFVCFFAPMKWRQRLVWLAVAVVAAMCCAGSGGRVYFVTVAASLLAGLLLLIVQLFRTKRKVWWYLIPLPLVVGIVPLVTYLPSPLQRVVNAIVRPWSSYPTSLSEWINALLLRIDPIRAVHMKVMAKAFWLHPWLGTGLGTFYQNYYEHLSWALGSGGSQYVDPPASFYLMLFSELGLIGLMLVVLSLIVLALATCEMLGYAPKGDPLVVPKTHAATQSYLLPFGVGGLVSLFISFLIGTHILFLSVSTFLGLCIFCLAQTTRFARLRLNFLMSCGCVAAMALIVGSGLQAYTAPRAPAFRWLERGVPQMPLSLAVPIATEERAGWWLSSGQEVLYEGQPLRLFVEMPPEFYPLRIEAVLRDIEGKRTDNFAMTLDGYDQSHPGRDVAITFPDVAGCRVAASASAFCSVQVRANPTWFWQRQPVAGFLVKSATNK